MNKSYNFHSVQNYYVKISGACKRLSTEEKEAGHEYVYCLFLQLWMKVLEQCGYFQLRLNSVYNETVQNVSIVGNGQVIPIIFPIGLHCRRFFCKDSSHFSHWKLLKWQINVNLHNFYPYWAYIFLFLVASCHSVVQFRLGQVFRHQHNTQT